MEPAGVCQLDEREPEASERRIRLPESLVTPEVGKARVDAHAGARCHDERARLANRERCSLYRRASGVVAPRISTHVRSSSRVACAKPIQHNGKGFNKRKGFFPLPAPLPFSGTGKRQGVEVEEPKCRQPVR